MSRRSLLPKHRIFHYNIHRLPCDHTGAERCTIILDGEALAELTVIYSDVSGVLSCHCAVAYIHSEGCTERRLEGGMYLFICVQCILYLALSSCLCESTQWVLITAKMLSESKIFDCLLYSYMSLPGP